MQTSRTPLVMWELTRACSAGCTQCPKGASGHRSPLELSTYEAYKTIDQIASLRPRELILTGGDPLERDDLGQLVDYARRRGFPPSVAISGTWRLTEGAVRKLAHAGVSKLILPLDASHPEQHERVRGSRKTFPPTLLAARWAHLAGMKVDVSTLATAHTAARAAALADLLEDIGTQRWNVYFLVPQSPTPEPQIMTAAEVEELFRVLHEMRARVPFEIRTFEAPHFRRFLLQHGIADADAAPDELLFISHHGDVMPGEFGPQSVGNVRYEPLRPLYLQSPLFASLREPALLKGKCGRCEYRDICGGSRARAFAMTGDLFGSDPFCDYEPPAGHA